MQTALCHSVVNEIYSIHVLKNHLYILNGEMKNKILKNQLIENTFEGLELEVISLKDY
jgi:hypothetical protein